MLRDSAFWTLHIRGSEWVSVHGLTVQGDMDFPNNDGIDIDGSSHVLVTDTVITTADDALCIKATRGDRPPTRHVLVSNCTLQSRSAAVKLGSESRADMSNITFRHLRVLQSNRGLAIMLRDHGAIRDVLFEHATVSTRRQPGRWWGGGEPLYVTALPRWPGSRVGPLSNVTFRNVSAESVGGVVVLAGSPESALRGVVLEVVSVRIRPLPTPQRGAVGARGGSARAGPAAAGVAEAGAPVGGPTGKLGQSTAVGGPRRLSAASDAVAWWLRIKLDLRPGPYDQRPFKATAPILAQFVKGLRARNVTLDLTAGSDAGSCSGRGEGQGRRYERQTVEEKAQGGARWWQLLLQRRGGEELPWYQELVPYTVQVAACGRVEQVFVRCDTTSTAPMDRPVISPSACGEQQLHASKRHDRVPLVGGLLLTGLTAAALYTVARVRLQRSASSAADVKAA